jgi:hypothetical protein
MNTNDKERITAYVTKETKDDLKKIANEKEWSLTKVTEKAIDKGLEKWKEEDEKK